MSNNDNIRQEIVQKRHAKEYIVHIPTISLLTKQNYLLSKRQIRTSFQSPYFKRTSSLVSPKKHSASPVYESPQFQRSNDIYNTKSLTGLSKLPNLDLNVPKDYNRLLLHSPSQITRSQVLIKQRLRMSSTRELPVKLDLGSEFNYVSSYGFRTQTGMMRGTSKKHNQDGYIMIPDFSDTKGQYLFGVFDGHGVNGHHVSEFIKAALPKNISTRMDIEGDYNDQKLSTMIKLSFYRTSRELNLQNNFDISFSGSTCVAVIIRSDCIIAANLGDSRAVLGRQLARGYVAIDLTVDHKPELEHEKNRIESAGGRVDTYRSPKGEPYGPYRVWFRDQNIPGLAMSRSFGDSVSARVGVISEPEISFHRILDQDRFVVIASDGLWEFISSQEVVEIVSEHIDMPLEQICDILVSEATCRWRKNEDMVDDITVILVMLRNS